MNKKNNKFKLLFLILIIAVSIMGCVLQSTSFLPIITPTPILQASATPSASSSTISNEVIDWRSLPVIGTIIRNIENLGDNPVLVAVLASLLTLFITFFNKIIYWIWQALIWTWSLISIRGKEYKFEREYLDWVVGQNRYLGLLPAQVVARKWGDRQKYISLEASYVRPRFSSSGGEDSGGSYSKNRKAWAVSENMPFFFVKTFLDLLLRLIDFPSNNNEIVETIGPARTIDLNKRLIIQGDPGSGKTTLLRYLALSCARALRQNSGDGDTRNLLRSRLRWGVKPFPIYVRLSRHGNIEKWHPEQTLLDAILDEIPADIRKHCPENFFERRLNSFPCLLLFDAFDELGSVKARALMAQKINGFIEAYDRPFHRTVVTTRIIGYEGQLDKYGFVTKTIQPLDGSDVKSLIKLRYNAISKTEITGRNEFEARSIKRNIDNRVLALLSRIENTSSLKQLAANPMLLSLIVLVHYLKVELPEERVLLYRDCIEILTERWQQQKREEAADFTTNDNELTLSQKIFLLREIAFEMQKRRGEKDSRTLIRKELVVNIVANKLPNILPHLVKSNGDSAHRHEILQLAENWITGIEANSGILIEFGLDQDGEPLVAFSHLTFQEYLAALAIHNTPEYQVEFWKNLLNPTWNEVVLLYSVLTEDASNLLGSLIKDDNPQGILLGGMCLLEKINKTDPSIQSSLHQKLINLFHEYPLEVGHILATISNTEFIQFLTSQTKSEKSTSRLASIKSLATVSVNHQNIKDIRISLVELLASNLSVEEKIAIREALSEIGDPRFNNIEPEMIYIPAVNYKDVQVHKPFESYLADIEDQENNPSESEGIFEAFESEFLKINWFIRKVDNAIYTFLRKSFVKSENYTEEFEISKYPITNIEFERFIFETKAEIYPISWKDGLYAPGKSTHPITGISAGDAIKYCNWLEEKTSQKYRLPDEWEWEIAAGGPRISLYPWGEKFINEKSNSEESHISETTPVDTFEPSLVNGLYDTCGNAKEYTYSFSVLPFFSLFILTSLSILMAALVSNGGSIFNYIVNSSIIPKGAQTVVNNFINNPSILLTLFTASLKISKYLTLFLIVLFALAIPLGLIATSLTSWKIVTKKHKRNQSILFSVSMRGGSWKQDKTETTILFRDLPNLLIENTGPEDISEHGFRVVRQVKK